MSSRTTALLIAALAAALIAWLFRYELVAIPAGGEGTYGTAYRLDRWTGEIKWIHTYDSTPVQDEH